MTLLLLLLLRSALCWFHECHAGPVSSNSNNLCGCLCQVSVCACVYSIEQRKGEENKLNARTCLLILAKSTHIPPHYEVWHTQHTAHSNCHKTPTCPLLVAASAVPLPDLTAQQSPAAAAVADSCEMRQFAVVSSYAVGSQLQVAEHASKATNMLTPTCCKKSGKECRLQKGDVDRLCVLWDGPGMLGPVRLRSSSSDDGNGGTLWGDFAHLLK